MFEIAFCTEQGPRERLEDAVAALKLSAPAPMHFEVPILLVLDGVGGNVHGDIASATARQQLCTDLSSWVARSMAAGDPKPIARDLTIQALTEALAQANRSMLTKAAEEPRLKGMATTAVCAVAVEGVLYVAWVGDSRCYVFRDGVPHQLTVDHSQTQELIEQGVITRGQAKRHLFAHHITRCLGRPFGVDVDTRAFRLEPRDIVLLCTDGLTDEVSDQVIASCVASCREGEIPFELLPSRLVDQALRAGTQDNVTVLCCDYRPNDGTEFGQFKQTLRGAYPARLARELWKLKENHDVCESCSPRNASRAACPVSG